MAHNTTCCTWQVLDVLHVICTRLRPGHLSVCVGDGSRCSEEIVKNLEPHLWMRLLLLFLLTVALKGTIQDFVVSSLHHKCLPTHTLLPRAAAPGRYAGPGRLYNNTNDNNSINSRIERHNSRFCTISSLHQQHIRSSGRSKIVCKSCAAHRALIMCNMSCATW